MKKNPKFLSVEFGDRRTKVGEVNTQVFSLPKTPLEFSNHNSFDTFFGLPVR